MKKFTCKSDARAFVWEELTRQKQAAFPFPIKGRIPNFVGSGLAAAKALEVLKSLGAQQVKINPDSPQRKLRELALRNGIRVYVPSPRLRSGFLLLDPAAISPAEYRSAASMKNFNKWGKSVSLEDFPQMDAVVTGSVAVTAGGKRCGKGHGYGDIEYAILAELGHQPVPIISTIHEFQLVGDFPVESHDIHVDFVVTPKRVIETPKSQRNILPIQWELLSKKDLEEMPVLQELSSMKGKP